MKGSNTLFLNEATLIEALQEYFDKRITPNISVKSVKKNAGGNYATVDTFEVVVTDTPTLTKGE